MKNNIIIPVLAVVVFSVLLTSGCITGQFASVNNETDDAIQEIIPDDASSSDFIITANIVLDDNIPKNNTAEDEEIVKITESVKSSGRSSGSSGSSGSGNDPPSTPPEPQEFTFSVYINSTENVVGADFMLSFTAGTEVVGDPVVGDFLEKDGTDVNLFVSETGTDILVGMLRRSRTGVSGSGELGNVTFMVVDPSEIELENAIILGERINGTQNILDVQIIGNTIYVQ